MTRFLNGFKVEIITWHISFESIKAERFLTSVIKTFYNLTKTTKIVVQQYMNENALHQTNYDIFSNKQMVGVFVKKNK